MPRTLAQNAQYIAETIKPAIKSAIEAQGVTVPSTDSFLDYADRIGEIEGGGSGYQLKDLPTGAISTVNDAAELPLNALKVSVEAVQSGSGTPSPSNIRPIHGWDSGIVNVESKNAVNLVFVNDTNSIVGLDFSHTVSSFTLSGTATGGYRIFQLTNLPKIKTGATYTYSVRVSGTKARCFVGFRFYKNGTEISGGIARANLNDGDLSSISFSLNSDFDAATYVIEGIQANTVFDCTVEVQLEAGDRVTAFTPYVNGNQYTLSFPQTIYGAEWDVINGELGLKITDGFYESYNGETLPGIWISDRDVYQAGTTPTIGAEVVYKLATPTTIPLSPLSIRMLEGTNNLYADCGEVIEGEYFVGETKAYDLVEYIESDGTQVIDTGRQVVQGQTIEVTFEGSNNQTAYAWIFGGITSSDYYGYQFPNSNTIYLYNGGTSASSQSGFSSNVLTQKALTFNGSANANIHILGLWDGSAYSNQGKFKVYSLDINGDYFVPAKRRSDGVYGLYDIANSQFLTDVASGNPLTGGNSLGIRIG